MLWIQALAVAALAAVHLFGGKLHAPGDLPRRWWLSLAGGVSVAYVFLHILPELSAAQEHLGETRGLVPWLEHHAYLTALVGLSLFYGLEQLVSSRQRQTEAQPGHGPGSTTTGMGVFWLHIGSFTLYNALVGHLLVYRATESLTVLALFTVAMALHFLVNDHALRHDHRNTYRRLGRWMLAAAIGAGWAIGQTTAFGETVIGTLFAFLAGGIVLNVLKEELPEQRESRFLPFALGAAGYAGLLLLL